MVCDYEYIYLSARIFFPFSLSARFLCQFRQKYTFSKKKKHFTISSYLFKLPNKTNSVLLIVAGRKLHKNTVKLSFFAKGLCKFS